MAGKNKTILADIVVEHYRELLLCGAVMIAITVWLYEYHYAVTSDDLVGTIAACLLFFGTMLLGSGIRGWRDGDNYRNRYIKMCARSGAEIHIRKRKKKNGRYKIS